MRFLDPQSLTGYTDRLYRAAWALCGSRQDAEDLVQETFARVLARPRLLRGEEAELAYLLRVLRNTFLTGRRDASRRPITTATLEDVVAADPRPTLAPDQALEVGEVYKAIAELPEHYRLALVAIDLLGLSYREAARAVGVREQTITTRLFRARRLVARRFSGELVEEAPLAAGSEAGTPPAGTPAAGAPEDVRSSSPGLEKTAPGTGRPAQRRSLSKGIGL
jgi:RNA polymerase sigma-70 factor (ECF subfamily)